MTLPSSLPPSGGEQRGAEAPRGVACEEGCLS
eukprot:CAMPEP_0115300896 /NCGR_PEP_ID=MMETSP0270-20121206/69571_1 /TAXON_ID=71861 /ORGANISM="Scrippsiella trochoidea, Strain CCMP3099" /LENGTH=31 /DNA_ID= /DNA_START= /DNA_END= /DNA_ORIENTATION=